MRTFLLLMLISTVSPPLMADDYLYPERIEIDLNCSIDQSVLSQFAKQYSDSYSGKRGTAKALAADINGDEVCEIFIDNPPIFEGNGNEFTTVLLKKGERYAPIGDIEGIPKNWWYGKPLNGLPQIFVPTYTGSRTNPWYVTDVYAFDGNRYVKEFDSSQTHGYYKDQGLTAYKSGNYAKALNYYINAYRMQPETRLADANDVAITWLKLGNLEQAKTVLLDNISNKEPTAQLAAAHFNLGVIEQKMGNNLVALHHYEQANTLSPSRIRQNKVTELRALAGSPP